VGESRAEAHRVGRITSQGVGDAHTARQLT